MATGTITKLRRPGATTAAGATAPPAGVAVASLSAERAALAAAVAGLAEHNARLAATSSALATVQERVYAARRRHEAAEAAVAKAKADAVTHLVDVAAGRAGEAPTTVRDAKRAAEDAADDLETLRAASTALDAELAGLRDSGTFRERAACRRRRGDRRHTRGGRARRAGRVAATRVSRRRSALAWLFSEEAMPAALAGTARSALGRIAVDPRTWRFAEQVPGAAPWKAVFAALLADPSAPAAL